MALPQCAHWMTQLCSVSAKGSSVPHVQWLQWRVTASAFRRAMRVGLLLSALTGHHPRKGRQRGRGKGHPGRRCDSDTPPEVWTHLHPQHKPLSQSRVGVKIVLTASTAIFARTHTRLEAHFMDWNVLL